MHRAFRLVLPLFVTLFAIAVAAQVPAPGPEEKPPAYLKEVGYDDLVNRLGDKVPKGTGVWMMQVEAPEGVNKEKQPIYRPDLKAALGDDRSSFTLSVPGLANGPISGHATRVSQHLFGHSSMAKGITKVELINPETEFVPVWLGYPSVELRTKDIPKVSNHSYVLDTPMPGLVRRLDAFIEKNDHIAVVAVGKNASGDPVAPVFGSSYNAIVVGLSNGVCGNGATRDGDDGPGRTKPDIVVPLNETSYATPVVAAAAALLVEAGGQVPNATKPAVIKACLMAGANKNFAGLELSGGWARNKKAEKPLNLKFGAGQLDINIAHRILMSGSQPPGMEALRKELSGWAYDKQEPNTPQTFIIDIPDEQQSTSVTIALTWNRRFTNADYTPIVPVFELALGRVEASGAFDRLIEISRSKLENSEIIWYTGTGILSPGRYGIRVTNIGENESEYALAWHVTTKAAPRVFRDKPRKSTDISNLWIYLGIAAGLLVIFLIFWSLKYRMFRPPLPQGIVVKKGKKKKSNSDDMD